MAAPNVNGRLHLTGVHRKPPASLENKMNFRICFSWAKSPFKTFYV